MYEAIKHVVRNVDGANDDRRPFYRAKYDIDDKNRNLPYVCMGRRRR